MKQKKKLTAAGATVELKYRILVEPLYKILFCAIADEVFFV